MEHDEFAYFAKDQGVLQGLGNQCIKEILKTRSKHDVGHPPEECHATVAEQRKR